jgi:excinuclease ABC subunit C
VLPARPGRHRTVELVRLADLATVPEAPGCYQFFEGAQCLYVGKARNLRQRLGNYLSADGPDDERIAAMVARADRLDWTVLRSETEALLTEAALIRAHNPVYNIRLRADHPYPSVALDGRSWPVRVRTWRGPARDGVETFGPYPQNASRAIVESIVALHRLASCDTGKYKLHERLGRPCLLAEIGRCSAPCVGRVEQDDYDASVAAARQLVGGSVSALREAAAVEMTDAAAAQHYERAAVARDRLAALEAVAAVQLIDAAGGGDVDVVAGYVDDLGGAACTMTIRAGALVAVEHVVVDAGRATVAELETAAAVELCAQRTPAALLLARHLGDDVRRLHRERAGGRARVRGPRTASETTLVAVAARNAEEALRRSRMRRASGHDARRAELDALAGALDLRRAPLRLESVDISHLGGAATVSVVAVLVDGLPARHQYRRYRLRDHGGDDYAAMREVLTRRLADSIDGKAPYPDLLLIDGGLGQLGVAESVVAELGVGDRVDLAALAKRFESIYRPGSSEPVTLEREHPSALLLQRARDETHQASNRFQAQVAARHIRRDWLDGIEGLGPRRKQRLLDHVGGWRGLEAADSDTVAGCGFLPVSVRAAVLERVTARRAAADERSGTAGNEPAGDT